METVLKIRVKLKTPQPAKFGEYEAKLVPQPDFGGTSRVSEKQTIHYLDIPIFGDTIKFTQDREVYMKMRDWHTQKPLNLEDAGGVTSDFGNHHLLGVFDRKVSTLIHEIGHIAFKVLRNCGVPVHHDGNQEAYCYLQEWIFEQLYPQLVDPYFPLSYDDKTGV